MKKYHFTWLLAPVIYMVSAPWAPRGGSISGGRGDSISGTRGGSVSRACGGSVSGGRGGSDPSGRFVGSAVCQKCHAGIYAEHIQTAHYLDSRPASAATIKGSFKGSHSHYQLNDRMEVRMEKKDGRFYQTALFNGNVMESEAFGIVIGSGRKGQTYLYWDGDRLFQLPISYYVPLNTWCNSPGYPSSMAYFGKQVRGECMECHGTYAKIAEMDGRGTVFDSASIMYGVDCERCHGRGAEHVAWHSAHPGELMGRYIVNARHLGRQQRLDACALCHSGFRKEVMPSYSFMVGDTLDNYSSAGYDSAATAGLDVHGNQYGLLTASKCFRMSDALDCQSCHDPHVNEYGKMAVYSARCVSCHSGTALHGCSMPEVKRLGLESNCIDCHMPALPSNIITLQVNGKQQPVHDLVRTHRVAIYPDIAKQYLMSLRKN